MLLLDTNVVSDLRKSPASVAGHRLHAWARSMNPSETFISAITLLEIEQGILRIERRDAPQGAMMRRWFAASVIDAFKDRTLSVDSAVALRAAALHVPQTKPERDALIGATALAHGMTMVTRNVKDFAPMGVVILDPWSP